MFALLFSVVCCTTAFMPIHSEQYLSLCYRKLRTETSTGLYPTSFWHSVVHMLSARLKMVSWST